MKGTFSHRALLDFISDLHGMVGTGHFRRDLMRELRERRLIAAPVISILEYDPSCNRTLVEDAAGPVRLQGVPLGDMLPGRQEVLPSFQRALAGNWEPTVTTQFLAPSKLRETAVYRDILLPMGLLDMLVVPLVQASKTYGMLFSSETCFTERDWKTACLLQRQLIVAMRNHQALLHAEESERLLRQASGRSLVLGIRPDGSIADWTPEAAAWFSVGPTALPSRPPDDLAEWVRRRVEHYPWLSPLENTLNYVVRRDTPPVHIHFLGRRDGRHELLCFRKQGVPPCHGLTDREKDVLRWICEGKGNAEMAVILGISINTVRNHIARILEKTMTENRLSAAALARNWFDQKSHGIL